MSTISLLPHNTVPMAGKPIPSTSTSTSFKDNVPVKDHVYHGFDRFGSKEDYQSLLELITKIQKDAAKSQEKKNDMRAVDMLVTDIEYIKSHIDSLKNIDTLEDPVKVKKADVLLQFLIDATKNRNADDFKNDPVNLAKLLQIIAKLKLWVPPKLPEDDQSKLKDAAKKKKEESPFVSSKDKETAASEIVERLFGLRCNQWGMDGLLKSYEELSPVHKLCLLCFSAFECEVEKVIEDEKGAENEYMISKSLKIKKRILIHWWVAEGLIDLHRKSIEDSAPPNPNPDPIPDIQTPNSDPLPNSPIANSNPNPIADRAPPIPNPNPNPTPETPNPNSDPLTNSPIANSNPEPIADHAPPILNPNPNPNPTPETPNPDSDPNLDQSKQQDLMTVEEIGEDILKALKEKGFIDPVIKAAQESSRVVMHPFVHSFLTALAKRAGFLDFSDKDGKLTPSFGLSQRACLVKWPDEESSCKVWEKFTDDRKKLKRFETVQTLFNVNEPIIDIKPEWFSKMTNLLILHLGSWRSEAVEHIEVEDTKFMEDLKNMVKMRLFSLQGVSTIMKLSDSVCKLENLVILDLRECHNLEELPDDIGCLKSLTHLDITNCHLLTKLPKGISLLSKLEVLKGFVIYDQDGRKDRESCFHSWCREAKRCVIRQVLRFKKKEECTLKDLGKLKELRQLSIVVNVQKFPEEDEVQVFKEMRKLRKLKIEWEKSFNEDKKPTTPNDLTQQERSASGNPEGKKEDGENPLATGAGKLGTPNPEAQQESSASSSFAVKKQDGESPSETGATKSDTPNAKAEQESGASGSPTSKKQDGENPLAAGVGKPDAGNVDDQEELRASCCLSLKCCNDSGVKKPTHQLLDQIEKLELWCYPEGKAPNWLNPNQLKNLKKLYIKGGGLAKVPGDRGGDNDKDQIQWKNIKTLRFKYLPNLDIEWLKFKAMFSSLEYLEKWECGKLQYFPCDQEGVWKRL